MGQSRVPLYVYVDESGNTGRNIFDKSQPDYHAAAFISKGDFDVSHHGRVRDLAAIFGESALHANHLGLGRIEQISARLLDIWAATGARFFVSRVQKDYLLATKMFDVLFDSGENASVAWHNYNLRPMRIILAFKLGHIISEEIGREFWQCLLSKASEAQRILPSICLKLKERLHLLPDRRSREVLSEGLDWVVKHPECAQFTTEQSILKKGHLPNLVAFVNLIDGLQVYSQNYKRKVAAIIHDEQNEFGRSLHSSHGLFSNAAPDVIQWAGESYSLQKVPGSRFEMKRDEESAGIQMADVALWLYGQALKGKELPRGCAGLINYVLENGWHNDFSFAGVERQLTESYGHVLFGPMPDAQLDAARRMLVMAEERRRASMAQYESDGLPPFMRPIRVTETESSEGEGGSP